MYYKNKPKFLDLKYSLIDFCNFAKGFDYDNNSENSSIAKLSINFNVDNNALKSSYGDSDFNCYVANDTDLQVYPNIDNLNIVDMRYFVSNQTVLSSPLKQLMVVTDDYKVYTTILDDGSVNYLSVMDLPINCKYRLIDYCFESTNYMVISTNENGICTNYICAGRGEPPKTIGGEFYIYDMCSHNNKMFVVLDEDYRNKVFFGEDLNPFNISKSLLEMRTIRIPASKGKILKLLSFGSYLYAFCEFGIYRVVLYVNQEKYYLEEVYNGNDKIIENTIAVGGDKIIFADENGIYVFNGNSVEKIDLKFNTLLKHKRKYMSVACVSNNKYFLATNLNYSDGVVDNYDDFRNNALIVYDLLDGRIDLNVGLSIRKMVAYTDAYTSRVAILSGDMGLAKLKTLSLDSGKNGDKILTKIWQSNVQNLNKLTSKKIIRFLYIKTKEDVDFELVVDNKKYNYRISGSDEIQRIIVNIKGYEFSFKLISESASPNIEFVKFLVGVYE